MFLSSDSLPKERDLKPPRSLNSSLPVQSHQTAVSADETSSLEGSPPQVKGSARESRTVSSIPCYT